SFLSFFLQHPPPPPPYTLSLHDALPIFRDPFAAALQRTVLAPFLTLQRQTDLVSASLQRYDAVLAQRDSAALAATFLPELRSENARLRGLLGLGVRLRSGYIPAEVLHQADPTNTLTFLVSA